MTKLIKNKKVIVVLGMHRSGTSVITRGLQVLGVSLGNNLMQPIKGNNDKGFFEDVDINALNVQMLQFINSEWFAVSPINVKDVEKLIENDFLIKAVDLLSKKISNDEIFAFKDPRVAKLLPFWNEVFKFLQLEVVYLIALRNPFNVAQSLLKRDGLTFLHSYILWVSHVLESLHGSIGSTRLIVDYDRLLISPESELKRIAGAGKFKFNENAFEIYLNDFLDPDLRHHVGEIDNLLSDSSCPCLVKEIFETLSNLTSNKTALDDDFLISSLEKWSIEFDRLREIFRFLDGQYSQSKVLKQALMTKELNISDLKQELSDLKQELSDLKQELSELNCKLETSQSDLDASKGVIEEIRKSRSWRITEPFRHISSFLKNK